MSSYPYLRAYMAGIVVPTMLLLVGITVFFIVRYIFQVPVPIERVVVFPMAIVPNMFGVWNMFYLWLQTRRHLPIGFHGALLPFLLGPIGVTLAISLGFAAVTSSGVVWFHVVTIPYPLVATGFASAVIVYYLVWKHLVAFFNGVLGLS